MRNVPNFGFAKLPNLIILGLLCCFISLANKVVGCTSYLRELLGEELFPSRVNAILSQIDAQLATIPLVDTEGKKSAALTIKRLWLELLEEVANDTTLPNRELFFKWIGKIGRRLRNWHGEVERLDSIAYEMKDVVLLINHKYSFFDAVARFEKRLKNGDVEGAVLIIDVLATDERLESKRRDLLKIKSELLKVCNSTKRCANGGIRHFSNKLKKILMGSYEELDRQWF